ncbi:DUF2249 domain-containing protein [Rufibacter sediminis]|uniref:DUF2249 domain-containing protein n=1 Tax=Rufibacter sediminis TaxID=2762756 RepID=A0ABR6VPB2_9BACT|nr:DUF2249 domain-containing protein [Rufibacter sediminis]MBC3539029.1 DUF2249 domain-containing protein [Rufibacter sediminis]
MEIAPATKISALIKANPAAIEAIAGINKHFEKLRNPVLRKILAARVTIADAARLGGCDVDMFFEKLAPLGFTVKQQQETKPEPKVTYVVPVFPLFLEKLPQNAFLHLDVREAIASGHDPFLEIMQAVNQVREDTVLVLLNTFEPTPLIQILQKKGFACFSEEKGEDLVYTYFWRESEKRPENAPAGTAVQPSAAFEQLLQKYQGRLHHLDVRQLEMPQPMVAILEELEKLPPGKALHVTHRRVPQFLLPQLQERGFAIAIQEQNAAEVHLLIYKET